MTTLRRSLLLVGPLLLLLPPAAASAHAVLERAEPGAGARVATAPAEVVLHFSESVEPGFSSVSVTDAAGASAASGPAHAAAGDARSLVVPLREGLAPGEYRVTWHVTSTDTHRTQGRFTFRVGR